MILGSIIIILIRQPHLLVELCTGWHVSQKRRTSHAEEKDKRGEEIIVSFDVNTEKFREIAVLILLHPPISHVLHYSRENWLSLHLEEVVNNLDISTPYG